MDIPLGNILTAVATVASVVVANRLSSSQTGKAKLWDLRREAYGIIVSELSSVERVCDVADSYMEESAAGYYQSDIRDVHTTRISDHMKIVRQRFSDSYLVLSDEFIALYEAFISDLETGPPIEFFPEDHERFCKIIRTHRPLLLRQGRAEITRYGRTGYWGRFI